MNHVYTELGNIYNYFQVNYVAVTWPLYQCAIRLIRIAARVCYVPFQPQHTVLVGFKCGACYLARKVTRHDKTQCQSFIRRRGGTEESEQVCERHVQGER